MAASVFAGREALLYDYVSARLPHREREFRRLEHYFKPLICGKAVSAKARFGRLKGEAFSCKILFCRKVGGIASGGRVKFAYVNPLRHGRDRRVEVSEPTITRRL